MLVDASSVSVESRLHYSRVSVALSCVRTVLVASSVSVALGYDVVYSK